MRDHLESLVDIDFDSFSLAKLYQQWIADAPTYYYEKDLQFCPEI